MNQSKNKQYTQTHHHLQQLLADLMQTVISIKKLCQMAKINRSTFYYHYLDVYDLADKTFQQANQDLMAKFKQFGPVVPLSQNSLTSFFQFIKENQKIFRLRKEQMK